MFDIAIGESAGVRVSHNGEWVIVYTEDGSGSVTTISLKVSQALDMSALLKGHAVTASGVKR